MATILKRPTKETTIVCGLGHVTIIFLWNASKHVARSWLQCHMYLQHSNENKSTSVPKVKCKRIKWHPWCNSIQCMWPYEDPFPRWWVTPNTFYPFIDHFSEYYYVFHLKDKIGIFFTFNSKIILFLGAKTNQ